MIESLVKLIHEYFCFKDLVCPENFQHKQLSIGPSFD